MATTADMKEVCRARLRATLAEALASGASGTLSVRLISRTFDFCAYSEDPEEAQRDLQRLVDEALAADVWERAG